MMRNAWLSLLEWSMECFLELFIIGKEYGVLRRFVPEFSEATFCFESWNYPKESMPMSLLTSDSLNWQNEVYIIIIKR